MEKCVRCLGAYSPINRFWENLIKTVEHWIPGYIDQTSTKRQMIVFVVDTEHYKNNNAPYISIKCFAKSALSEHDEHVHII